MKCKLKGLLRGKLRVLLENSNVCPLTQSDALPTHLVHLSIANVRETRVTGIISHLLLFLTLFLIPYPIAYIPTAVLNGLFLYMAVTSLDGLQVFERILLLFTEQVSAVVAHTLLL